MVKPVNTRWLRALAALALLVLASPVFYFLQIWPEQKSDHQAVVFNIAQGASLTQVADELTALGLTDSPVLFRLYASLSGSDRELRAGTYEVPSRQNARELLALFSSGKVQQHAIRLPEGMNLRVVSSLLAEQAEIEKKLEEGGVRYVKKAKLDGPSFEKGAKVKITTDRNEKVKIGKDFKIESVDADATITVGDGFTFNISEYDLIGQAINENLLDLTPHFTLHFFFPTHLE